MTARLIAIGLTLCAWSAAALGQTWTVYVPPEKDFTVLFPTVPGSAPEANGAVAFTSRWEDATFTVYRRDPARDPFSVYAIQERLRGHHDDRGAARIRNEDDEASGQLIFVTRGTATIHRIVKADQRYYELVVAVPRTELPRTRRIARDFFSSFQLGGAPVAAGALAAQTPDVLCKGRSNAFSRAFCEYSTCLKSQHRGQPFCQKLLQFR